MVLHDGTAFATLQQASRHGCGMLHTSCVLSFFVLHPARTANRPFCTVHTVGCRYTFAVFRVYAVTAHSLATCLRSQPSPNPSARH